jgi:hypothetical protein
MDSEEVRRRLRAELGLHVGPQVAAYVAAQLAGAGDNPRPIPLLAQDARTGLAVRRELELEGFGVAATAPPAE